MFVRPIMLTLLTGHRRGGKEESDHLHTRLFQPVVPCRQLAAQEMADFGNHLDVRSLRRVDVAARQKRIGIGSLLEPCLTDACPATFRNLVVVAHVQWPRMVEIGRASGRERVWQYV